MSGEISPPNPEAAPASLSAGNTDFNAAESAAQPWLVPTLPPKGFRNSEAGDSRVSLDEQETRTAGDSSVLSDSNVLQQGAPTSGKSPSGSQIYLSSPQLAELVRASESTTASGSSTGTAFVVPPGADPGEKRDDPTAVGAFSPAFAAGGPAGRRAMQGSVSRSAFLLLATYASLVTLTLAVVLYKFVFGPPHQLESLPDILPPPARGGLSLRIVAPQNELPRGHTVPLGTSRRFGDVVVTPLKVTRGPVEIETRPARGEAASPPEVTRDVLKLWLRFENVSPDHKEIPLDPVLVYARGAESKRLANTFVTTKAGRTEPEPPFVMMYEIPLFSRKKVVGEDLGHPVLPGQSWETFLPTEESGLEDLRGDLLWRVQFRKGYSPRGYGVTTLIEIPFNTDKIQKEPPPSATAAVLRETRNPLRERSFLKIAARIQAHSVVP